MAWYMGARFDLAFRGVKPDFVRKDVFMEEFDRRGAVGTPGTPHGEL